MITKTIWFYIMTVLTVFLMPGPVYSLERGGMDFVLVMDSSGSMKKTDPLKLRVPAAKLFISLLDKNDRAGVVSFSDMGYPVIYLTPVDSQSNRERLLKATEKISSKGLYTNLYDALNIGLDLLSRDKPAKRVQTIILMSDGKMDLGDPNEDRRLLDMLRNDLLKAIKDRGIQVYTIAFSELSDLQLLEEIARETGGLYSLVTSDKDIHKVFTSIFENLKTPEMLPIDKNRFFVDSSIEEVIIIANKASPDTKIYLESPDGKRYSSEDSGAYISWFVSHSFDMITVKRPIEGQWEILFSTGKDNKAYIITDLRLQTSFDRLHHILGKSVDIKAWLEKDGALLSNEDILEKIDTYIEVLPPAGEVLKKPLNRDENGIFTTKLIPDKIGHHRVRIVAKGATFERERSFTFSVLEPSEGKKDHGHLAEEEEGDREKENGKRKEEVSSHEVTEEVSWGSALVKFFLINLILGIAGLICLKKKCMKEWIQSIIKRSKDN